MKTPLKRSMFPCPNRNHIFVHLIQSTAKNGHTYSKWVKTGLKNNQLTDICRKCGYAREEITREITP